MHQCNFHFCNCQTELAVFIRYGLWPATPVKASTVISIEILNLFVAMQLEGKISLVSFCDAMAWRSGFLENRVVCTIPQFLRKLAMSNILKFNVFQKHYLQARKVFFREFYFFIFLFQKQCLYRFLQTDSIDQFRQFRRNIVNLKTMCEEYDGFEKCSACPKVKYSYIVAV